jgi:hypothetical protein
MNRKILSTLTTIFIVLAIAGILYYVTSIKSTGAAVSEDAVKYIGTHSVVYVQAGCIHCKEQEDLFGDSWKYINSVDCLSSEENRQACILANITGTPTWVINGQKYEGRKTIAELENLTGYK